MINYRDKHGLYHHVKNPNPDSSSNSPVFTAAVLALKKMLGEDIREEADQAILSFTNPKNSYYVNYHHSTIEDHRLEQYPSLSHDNWKGILALHYLAGKKMNLKFEIRSHLRPDNFCLWVYSALDQRGLKLLGLPFLLIYSISLIITSFRRYKVRNGEKIRGADNKQMGFFICVALNLRVTYWLMTEIIKRNSWFGSWLRVFERYYLEGHSPAVDHPAVLIAQRVESEGKF